ncbi:MAG: transglycosylase SLT domain-containing protein [Deltaproteobacteria bacterium]|nr:transglycosylase SLT domain-containing protein [Deltaproteobacteria bacterium]
MADALALGAGVRAFRAGAYDEAIKELRRAHARHLNNDDYAQFYLAEALLATRAFDEALSLYKTVSHIRESRFATIARWRVADALWDAQRTPAAVAEYQVLLKAKTPSTEAARAWMRVGTAALANKDTATARAAFGSVVVHFATHALAKEAQTRLQALTAKPADTDMAASALPASLRIARARRLSDQHQWSTAIAELEALQQGLTPQEAALRDFVLGQAKYRSRTDYAGASRLLYQAVPLLPEKEAVWAAFHGARALSRADRDDEAIAGYLRFVQRYPKSSFTAEAQFLAGWLDFNQGRFAAARPALRETVNRFARSPFAIDAAWYLAMGAYFANDLTGALRDLAAFAAIAQKGGKQRLWPADRVTYWRARIFERLARQTEANALYTQLGTEQPLRWYGLLATARLREQKLPDPLHLPVGKANVAPLDAKALRDPALLRVDELLAVQLHEDAGYEIERAATALLKRLGRAKGLMAVITRSNAAGVWAKSYRLADLFGSDALAYRPQGDVRLVWEAIYPLAYPDLVKKYGPPAGNPEHYLHAIMHKESGFDPRVISYADARGLLQMIPPTSRKVAQLMNQPYSDEDLLLPEPNVRLGATYIGSLFKKFRQQMPLSAGSYNAGPGAMMRWLDRFGTRPTDEFVELIPYEQTREYSKRVCSIYARYRYLYAGERYVPPLQLDPNYSREEPNY